MMSDDAHNRDLIRKVDALLNKHRGMEPPVPSAEQPPAAAGETGASAALPSSEPPLPPDTPSPLPQPPDRQPALRGLLPPDEDPDIPVLTEVVLPPPPLFEQPEEAQAQADADWEEPDALPARPGSGGDTEPSVITRVQTQNLEHQVYLKLKASLDQQIAQVVEKRFLPAIGHALDQAVERMAARLESGVARQVQSSLREVQSSLRQVLTEQARSATEALPAPGTETASSIMPAFPPASPPMDLAKSFEPQDIERSWYGRWEAAGYFRAGYAPGKPGYCILLPPPNVTGTLHMGHAFQHTLMDALIRYQRMSGRNTLWQPGTDHAGIATQIVVERQLEQQRLDRRSLGRENFVERVWQWKAESGSTITRQMRRLGASCDWERERFTMDEGLSRTVADVFVRLYQQGLIYRGKRLVNWDPVLQTAVSDLEVVSEEEDGQLWHIRYPLEDGSSDIVVATTRPETMLGDVAVAVNPNDARYAHLLGRRVVLPLTGRSIPVIADAVAQALNRRNIK
jgi:hypothetical protein